MEDWNILAADCVVICCCCQCLILQILIAVFLRLPYKLAKKSKKLARRRRREDKTSLRKDPYRGDTPEIPTGDTTTEVFHGYKCPIEEAQKVMEEISDRGEFAFGSFWGRNGSRTSDDLLVSNPIIV